MNASPRNVLTIRVLTSFLAAMALGILAPGPSSANTKTLDTQRQSLYIEPLGRSVEVIRVTSDQLAAAMTTAVSRYNVVATTNAGRFQSDVVMHLIRRMRAADPRSTPLYVHADDWHRAFLATTGLPPESMPSFIQIPKRNQQKTLIDYSPGCVISKVNSGREPILAANVLVWWASEHDYRYLDTSSEPHLQVTNVSPVTYRLMDFGNRIVVAEIEGIKGRPVTGPLGALFKAIGDGSVEWSRFSIAPDGTAVLKAKAKKAFASITTTVTVFCDGNVMKGIPEDRPDLEQAANYLEVPVDFEYVDLGIRR